MKLFHLIWCYFGYHVWEDAPRIQFDGDFWDGEWPMRGGSYFGYANTITPGFTFEKMKCKYCPAEKGVL